MHTYYPEVRGTASWPLCSSGVVFKEGRSCAVFIPFVLIARWLNTGITLILQFQLDCTVDNKKNILMMQATVATQRCPRNETPRWFRTLRFKMKVAKGFMHNILGRNECN